MEQFLLRLYSHLPKWMKQLVSPRMRDGILRGLVFFDSKPDLNLLELQRSVASIERDGDWEAAVVRWQFILAMTVSQTSLGRASEDTDRRAVYAKNRLRIARLNFAMSLHRDGKFRAFREQCYRIVESMPDQRILKNDRRFLDLICLNLQDALKEDGVEREVASLKAPKRIVICMDVLKVSKVHTHVRVIFTMCRNLLRLDEGIEISIFVTGERYAVPTPITVASFLPLNETGLLLRAKAEFGSDYNHRLKLNIVRSGGLDGMVETCKTILSTRPDVVLYGGGHKGMFSNESRVIRHALFDYLPTAFFFIQSNNEVDDKMDTIIARGPHDIIGSYGTAEIKVQPYPTMDPTAVPVVPKIEQAKHARKVIVSAIAGVRMTQKISEITDRTQKELLSILDAIPTATWHFVGAEKPDEFLKRNPIVRTYVKAGRIKIHPILPMKEFRELVENASLFYHMPGFTGGSGGASVARRAGVPIITFNHSDVAGRQPANTVFTHTQVDKSVQLAVHLLQDLEAWTGILEAQIAHTEWIRETAPQGFYQCLEGAVTKAHARLRERETITRATGTGGSEPEAQKSRDTTAG